MRPFVSVLHHLKSYCVRNTAFANGLGLKAEPNEKASTGALIKPTILPTVLDHEGHGIGWSLRLVSFSKREAQLVIQEIVIALDPLRLLD